MKAFLYFLVFSFATIEANCQETPEIMKIFEKVDVEYLSKDIIDSLILKSPYYPSTNNPDNIKVYELLIDSSKIKARIYSGYESGQSGYQVYEIRLFNRLDGNLKVVCSISSGSNGTMDQLTLQVFDFTVKSGILLRDRNSELVFKSEISDFFKKGTPDSVITKFESHSGYRLELFYSEAAGEFRLHEFLIQNNEQEDNFLAGNKIRIMWLNDRFRRAIPEFSKEY